nr:uncharacterized protein LOC116768196 [Danaus plexippus plexippus]
MQKSKKRKRASSYSPNQNQQTSSGGPKKVAVKNAFERSMGRSMLKIRRYKKTRSEDIGRKTRLTDALEQALRLKWKWAAHLSRYIDKRRSLQTTKWAGPAGKRSRGRPLKRWADDIKELVGKD